MDDFRAPRWLPGGHAQTIWPAVVHRRLGAKARFRRERWAAPDGDFVDIDWQDVASEDVASEGSGTATARASSAAAAPPLLVLFHGLEGSSSSHYAQAFAAEARRRAIRFAVPHFRGCSGELNHAPRAYHSGDFEEVAWLLARFRAGHAGPVLAAGVSLGGNALLRYAQEAGGSAHASVAAVAAISAPLDLAAGGRAIGHGFGHHVYSRMFLGSMKPKALRTLARHPGLFDLARLHAVRSLRDFDDLFTAPLHGFRDADDYYARASAGARLARIRIPALVVNAANDPFLPASALPRPGEVGSHVTLWRPAQGGHAGFVAGAWPGHVRTMPERVVSWLLEHAGASAVRATGA